MKSVKGKLSLILLLSLVSALILTGQQRTMAWAGNKYLVGDIDINGRVDWMDNSWLGLSYGADSCFYQHGWGQLEYNPEADLDKDGKVTWMDLSWLGLNYGKSTPWHSPMFDWEITEQTTYWAKSSWGRPNEPLTWEFFSGAECMEFFGSDSRCTMSMDDDDAWNCIGLFQGHKPFGWGTAPQNFAPVPDYKDSNFEWAGMKVDVDLWWGHIDAQCNIGLDLWIELYFQGDFYAELEFLIFFDQTGGFSLPQGGWNDLGWVWSGDNCWYSIQHRLPDPFGDLDDGVPVKLVFNLDDLIAEAKQHANNLYVQNSVWYIHCIDCLMEGLKCEAEWVFYYGNLYVKN